MQEPKRPVLKSVETRKPNPALIHYCEVLLEWAKTGDLRGIVGVAVWQGYSLSSIDMGRDGTALRTICGQLDVVKTQILDEIIAHEQETDDEAS